MALIWGLFDIGGFDFCNVLDSTDTVSVLYAQGMYISVELDLHLGIVSPASRSRGLGRRHSRYLYRAASSSGMLHKLGVQGSTVSVQSELKKMLSHSEAPKPSSAAQASLRAGWSEQVSFGYTRGGKTDLRRNR